MATIKKACKGTSTPKSSSVSSRLGSPSKAKSGTSLGMKSVKAGFDKNPGVTRADIIVAGKGQAKKGMKVKKAQGGKMIVPHEATHRKEPNEPFKQKGTFTSPKFKNKMDSVIQTNKQMFGDKKASTKFEALKKGGKVGKCKYGCK